MKISAIKQTKQTINFSEGEVIAALIDYCKHEYEIPKGFSIEMVTKKGVGVELHILDTEEINTSIDLKK